MHNCFGSILSRRIERYIMLAVLYAAPSYPWKRVSTLCARSGQGRHA